MVIASTLIMSSVLVIMAHQYVCGYDSLRQVNSV